MTTFVQSTAQVVENVRLARDTFRIRLDAADIARLIRPGQFLMLRIHGGSDPLLGRPFALYDTVVDQRSIPIALDVVYLVVGKATRRLAELGPGARVEVWGPLGNGFPPLEDVPSIGLIAGGIGQTPFLAYARQLTARRAYGGDRVRQAAARVTLYYGVRSAELAAGIADFEEAGALVRMATDDGSLGFHGFVTDLLAREDMPGCLVGCGPEPMLKALRKLALERNIPCYLSLETPMACGVGICFSCVAPTRTPDGWDYRRVCVEGPVFDARELAW